MEVQLLGSEGIPECCVLSVCSGSLHRYMHTEASCKVHIPSGLGEPGNLRVDAFAHIGVAEVEYGPGGGEYQLKLAPVSAGSSSGISKSSKRHSALARAMHLRLQLRESQVQPAALEKEHVRRKASLALLQRVRGASLSSSTAVEQDLPLPACSPAEASSLAARSGSISQVARDAPSPVVKPMPLAPLTPNPQPPPSEHSPAPPPLEEQPVQLIPPFPACSEASASIVGEVEDASSKMRELLRSLVGGGEAGKAGQTAVDIESTSVSAAQRQTEVAQAHSQSAGPKMTPAIVPPKVEATSTFATLSGPKAPAAVLPKAPATTSGMSVAHEERQASRQAGRTPQHRSTSKAAASSMSPQQATTQEARNALEVLLQSAPQQQSGIPKVLRAPAALEAPGSNNATESPSSALRPPSGSGTRAGRMARVSSLPVLESARSSVSGGGNCTNSGASVSGGNAKFPGSMQSLRRLRQEEADGNVGSSSTWRGRSSMLDPLPQQVPVSPIMSGGEVPFTPPGVSTMLVPRSPASASSTGATLLNRSAPDHPDSLAGCTSRCKAASPLAVPPLRLGNVPELVQEADALKRKERLEAREAKLKKEEEIRQKAEKAKEQAYQEAKERAEAHARELGLAPVEESSGPQAMREGLQAQLQMLTALCSRPAASAGAPVPTSGPGSVSGESIAAGCQL